jgi:hypothetical protein
VENVVGAARFGQFEFDNFFAANNAQGQGESKYETRRGAESGSGFEGYGGAAEHPLDAPHQVVMADESQESRFGKAQAEFVTGH